MAWYDITDEHVASFKSAAASAKIAAGISHSSGNDPMISMTMACFVGGAQLLGQSGIITLKEHAQAKAALYAAGAPYAAQAAATSVTEKPAATAAEKVARVEEGSRITRLANGRVPPDAQAKLASAEARRAKAVVEDGDARRLVIHQKGPQEIEALRKIARRPVILDAKAKGPKLS